MPIHETARRVLTRSERNRVAFRDETPSRTKQSFKDQCDVNVVVRKYATAQPEFFQNPRPEQFGDATGVVDLQEAINLIRDADEAFASLPSSVRKLAGNDRVNFLRMLADEEGVELLKDAGFLPAPERRETPPETPDGETPTPAAQPASSTDAT